MRTHLGLSIKGSKGEICPVVLLAAQLDVDTSFEVDD